MTIENTNDNVSAHVSETNLTIPAEQYIVPFTQDETRRLISKPIAHLTAFEKKRFTELQNQAERKPLTDLHFGILLDDNRFMLHHLPKNFSLTRFQIGLLMHDTTFRRIESQPGSTKLLHTFLSHMSVLPSMTKTHLKQVAIHAGKKFHNSDIYPIVKNVVMHKECKHDIVWNSISHVTLGILRSRDQLFSARVDELKKEKGYL